MKIGWLLSLIFFMLPLKQEYNLVVLVPNWNHGVFNDYKNDNFRQRVLRTNGGLQVEIHSREYVTLNLKFRIFLDKRLLKRQDRLIQTIIVDLARKSPTLEILLRNLSIFLKGNIRYSEELLPQDPVSVIKTSKAHCVGYSNLVQLLLRCVGISSRFVKGFYLKERADIIIPVSHRWLEIFVGDSLKFFYDPQYQSFNYRYIVINHRIRFSDIKKFKGHLVKLDKKIIDE